LQKAFNATAAIRQFQQLRLSNPANRAPALNPAVDDTARMDVSSSLSRNGSAMLVVDENDKTPTQ
jgi:hypothetical protein